jgi:deoxyxylulose-5-phosphate synthase
MIALPDQFLPHGKASDILREHGLDAAGVARSVYVAVRGAVPSEEKKKP